MIYFITYIISFKGKSSEIYLGKGSELAKENHHTSLLNFVLYKKLNLTEASSKAQRQQK